MSFLLVGLAFILIVIGVFVQTAHHNCETRFAVTWTTGIAALCFLIFAAKVYFS
jgi:hypothetical protein